MRMKTCLAGPDSGRHGHVAFRVARSLFRVADPELETRNSNRRARLGFTLIETILATCFGAVMLLALYACFAGGYSLIKVTREDLRATQIALERMEAIRLAPYANLKDPTKFPTTMTVYFDEKGKSTGKGGVPYTVTFNAGPLPPPKPQSSFYTNMMQLTVGVSWKSGNLPRSRTMQTYVAKYGVQGYVGASN